jgi:hypothetical protein
MLPSSKFEHDGSTFEIRGEILLDDRRRYRVYLNGEHFGDTNYNVDAADPMTVDQVMIAQAESDVRNGLWEQRQKADRELKNQHRP